MPFIEITAAELKDKINTEPNLFIIDVRDEFEFEDNNIGGINIPMRQVLAKAEEFSNHKEIYLCCKSGKRSKTVAYHLSQTLLNVKLYTLTGGISEYQNQ